MAPASVERYRGRAMRTARPVPLLTPREHEIVRLLAEGHKDSAIGRRLGISTSTVRTYVMRIQARLRIDGRGAIAAWALARGIANHPDIR